MARGLGKSDVVLVVVRPVRTDERRRWGGEMAKHHHLGFKRFAGRAV